MTRVGMKTGVMIGAIAAAAGLAGAGIETQSIAIDIDSDRGEFGTNFTFNQFDTQGGTRVLTGVNLRFAGDLFVEATAQSFSADPIAAGAWSADVFHNVLVSFFTPGGGDGDGDGLGGDGGPSAPFYGLGGIGIVNFTGDLAPGVPGGGGPFDPGIPGDPITESFGSSINSLVPTSAGFFDYYTGTGTVEGFAGPFTDIVLDVPGFLPIDVFASRLTQLGTLSLDYEFTVVPAPASVAGLMGFGLLASRRRR